MKVRGRGGAGARGAGVRACGVRGRGGAGVRGCGVRMLPPESLWGLFCAIVLL